mmetsp:Transcript_27008/g.70052  ORF Transcript_27008/g.70052 Transcript_27008/m.70052 type:complete len:342 (+) Transcript_27008:1325-2350(+)
MLVGLASARETLPKAARVRPRMVKNSALAKAVTCSTCSACSSGVRNLCCRSIAELVLTTTAVRSLSSSCSVISFNFLSSSSSNCSLTPSSSVRSISISMPAPVETLGAKMEFSRDMEFGVVAPEESRGVSGVSWTASGTSADRRCMLGAAAGSWSPGCVLSWMCRSSNDMLFPSLRYLLGSAGWRCLILNMAEADLASHSKTSSADTVRLWLPSRGWSLLDELVSAVAARDSRVKVLERLENCDEVLVASAGAAGFRLSLGLDSLLRMYSFCSARCSFWKWVDLRKCVETSLATSAAMKVARQASVAQAMIFSMVRVTWIYAASVHTPSNIPEHQSHSNIM